MKRAQGLPIHTIIILTIAVIVLVVILLYAIGVIGQGESSLGNIFGLTNRTVHNASEGASKFIG